MKRRKPLQRKEPLRRGYNESIPEFQQRTEKRKAKRMPTRTPRRRTQEAIYRGSHEDFLAEHQVCPVTGERTTQIHHSAGRIGMWLNLQRYWIAVSMEGHLYIEANKNWAETVGLIVRIRDPYFSHVKTLEEEGKSLTQPVFYDTWNGSILRP